MEINEYQKKAMTTCMPTCNNIVYMGFNLAAECGELLGKFAKAVRKDHLHVVTQPLTEQGQHPLSQSYYLTDEQIALIRKEAGDVLWQLSGLCSVMGWKLDDVACENLEKLASRQQRGVIDGNGDER